MALETVFTTAVINGLVGLGVKIFGEMTSINIDEPFKRLLFNATKKYVQTYTERHGHVQVLGMSKPIPLDDIYSGARMLDTEAMKSYASQADLEVTYRNKGQRRFRDYDCPKRNGIEIAKENSRLIVLGDPGIGKSTYLRKAGLEALKGKSGDYQLPYIPVFLELKRFRSTKVDLKNSIATEFKSCGFPSPEEFTENALRKGQLLLLLDGLDEVPADNLNTVIESIQDLVDEYSGNRFIASCRIAAYHTYFKRVSTVAISEFDDNQIERFIYNWFSSEVDRENQTAEQCWKRLQQPENKGAKELAQSPLLLTFLCLVYNKSLTVPSSRTSLYEDALNILLKEWASEKRVGRGEIYEGFHADLEKELLAKIAYEGFENDQLFFSKEQLINYIADFLSDTLDAPKNLNASAVLEAIELQQGILVERATDVYSFSHLTLQEFLAAKYILTWNLQEDLVEFHFLNDHWREVFLLVSGLMKGGAIRLLEKLEVQTQKLSEHLKLKEVLAWAEAKTSYSASDYPCDNKRIFALKLIFVLVLVCEITNLNHNNFPSNLSIRFYSETGITSPTFSTLICNSDSAINMAEGIVTIIGTVTHNISGFSSDISIVSHRGNVIVDVNSDKRTITPVADFYTLISLFKFCLEEELLKNIEFRSIISYLEILSEQSKVTIKDLTSQISSSLDIAPNILDLSQEDVIAITNYLSTCQLMLNCSKQASGLSAQQWEAIKQRMFLPPQP